MKKMLTGAILGAIFLFIYQFLSWGALELHYSQMQHTPNQAEILEALDGKLEPGVYMLPRTAQGAPQEEAEALYEQYLGKSWARIEYHDDLNYSMGMNLIRGFVVNFVACLLLMWLLMQFREVNMSKSIIAALSVGSIGFLTSTYLNSIWFELNTLPDLLDVLISWVGVGAILGFIVPKNPS